METITKHSLDKQFKLDVMNGLTGFPKNLSSKYFYDKKGDNLFQQIMNLPEYYLTRCEYEIFSTFTQEIGELFRDRENGMDLIELGAGDGKKTKVLLKYMAENNFNFVYKPIDISQNAVENLSENLAEEMPNLSVDAEVGEYFEILNSLESYNKRKKVILFLGSNIGNLSYPQTIQFLKKLRESLQPNDFIFLGADNKKHPKTILNAYNDNQGVTEKFNKNLLNRINRELDANFNTEKFIHWPTYNPETGTSKSYLVSTEKQKVNINSLNITISFDEWETIHTEISQKYDIKTIVWLAEEAGLKIEKTFSDRKGYYTDYVMRKK